VSVGGDRDDSKVQELETLLQYIRDLEDERKELKDELERARLRF
jgi:cell division septum initiation protein DivIVA